MAGLSISKPFAGIADARGRGGIDQVVLAARLALILPGSRLGIAEVRALLRDRTRALRQVARATGIAGRPLRRTATGRRHQSDRDS